MNPAELVEAAQRGIDRRPVGRYVGAIGQRHHLIAAHRQVLPRGLRHVGGLWGDLGLEKVQGNSNRAFWILMGVDVGVRQFQPSGRAGMAGA